MNLKKAFLFGTLSLFSVASTTGAEQFQKEDFEAVVKRGYSDFLDRVGQEKFKELGFEEPIYEKFLNGRLIYKPDPNSDIDKIEFRIADLANPLEGAFDLSKCGNIGKYLSISTGYRKAKKPENAHKVEIWFAPRFLIERELGTTAAHFKPIMDNWKQDVAPVGMFWTWGGWDDLGWYDYLTKESMENLSKMDLYVHFQSAIRSLDGHIPRLPKYTGGYGGRFSSFVCELSATEK